MKFQVGDTVILIHSNEEGEIVDILNKNMVLVDVKGVRFPAYMDQIDFPYFRRFTEKKKIVKTDRKFIDDIKKEKAQHTPRTIDGVWLTFLPVIGMDEFGDDVVEELKLHLVNRTDQAYKFDYKQAFFGKPAFELKNQIRAFEDFYLHDLPFEDMNDNPIFEFEFSLDPPQKNKAEICTASIKIKPRQLFQRIEEIRSRNEATFSYRLFDFYPDRKKEDLIDIGSLAGKYKVYEISKTRQNLEQPRSVVDLHIEKITDEWKGLSNLQIIGMQMRTFEKYYELALAHLQPSLVVIHGVGSGRLRDEIHEWLKHRKEVKTFINQYDPRFGYGATEIFFQY